MNELPLLPFKPEAIIFDLDGTLLDTETLYSDAYQAVMEPYGHHFSLEFKRRIMGGNSKQSAELTVDEYDLPMTPEEFLAHKQKRLEQLFPTAAEITGAGPYLEHISSQGITLGLATSSDSRHFEMKTAQRKWRSLFKQVVCGDDPELMKGKPAPDIFLLCAARLGIRTKSIIAFEDSRNGILAAKAAGMTVVAINSPYVSNSDLQSADIIIENFVKLM